MFRTLLFFLLIFSFQSVYSQKRHDTQKYIYEDGPLTIEVKSYSPYSLHKEDTIKLSVKFINKSYDTLFIQPFKKLIKYSESFILSFSDYNSGNMDWDDTLLVIDKESELSYYFILSAKNFYSEGIIQGGLDVNYVLSIDTLRKNNLDKQTFRFENKKLIIAHSKIEAYSEWRELRIFSFRIDK